MSTLTKFLPPEWAKIIRNIPEHYVKLSQRNTPIHKWRFSGIPEKFQLSIKRDDMTGSSLSGNKVRKLEFLLADALSQNCDSVMTCGGIQSNHCRATALAARQLGMKCYLFLRSDIQDGNAGCRGNVLLKRMVGSQIILIPKRSPYEKAIKPRMEKMAELLREQGSNSYLIPVGGSNHVGVFGYITAFQELIEQNALDNFDDIVVAIGSGGTASGIAIANYLTGFKLRCHAVAVSDNKLYFYDHIDQELKECGLKVKAREIIDVIDDYVGNGYAKSTEEELSGILKISVESGIILDRVYTGKAVLGMVKEMQNNPGRFKGSRILFVHTGGIFCAFDGELDNMLQKTKHTNLVSCWKNMDDPVPML